MYVEYERKRHLMVALYRIVRGPQRVVCAQYCSIKDKRLLSDGLSLSRIYCILERLLALRGIRPRAIPDTRKFVSVTLAAKPQSYTLFPKVYI